MDVGSSNHHVVVGVLQCTGREYLTGMEKMFRGFSCITFADPPTTHEAEDMIQRLLDTGRYSSWSMGSYHRGAGSKRKDQE